MCEGRRRESISNGFINIYSYIPVGALEPNSKVFASGFASHSSNTRVKKSPRLKQPFLLSQATKALTEEPSGPWARDPVGSLFILP